MTGKDKRGFSLIELLVVMAMLGIVMASIYSLYLTHQRAAYTEEDVVEVQQNLRIAMDGIARDIRMAGFLLPVNPMLYPINTDIPNVVVSGPSGTLYADFLTLQMASAPGKYARIAASQLGSSLTFTVDSPDSVDAFSPPQDYVRIIRPQTRTQPTGGTVFHVISTDRNGPTIGLQYVSGQPYGAVVFDDGDIISATTPSDSVYNYPNTVMYCLGPAPATGSNPDCGSTVTDCPVDATGQTKCLMRVVNGTASIIATNVTSLHFSYLLDNGTEINDPINPTDNRSAVRDIRVTMLGQTAATLGLTNFVPKVRTITSVVKIRNR